MMTIRRGEGDRVNKTLEKLFNETVNDFGTIGIKRPTESNVMVVVGARRVIAGMNIAQYFMVEPLIDELLDHLPKPVAKEVFESICRGIGSRINQFYEEGEDENTIDTAIAHNQTKLRKLGIPKEKWKNYGGEWPEGMKANE